MKINKQIIVTLLYIVLVFHSFSVQANETAKNITSTYHFRNSQNLITGDHWNITQISQIISDQGSGTISESEFNVGDVALVVGENRRSELFFINRLENDLWGANCLYYARVQSIANMNADASDIFTALLSEPDAELGLQATGIDAWPAVNNNNLTKLAVCDYTQNRVILYNVSSGNIIFDRIIGPPENGLPVRVNKPIDVAKFRNNGSNEPTYVAILNEQGTSLLIYDYENTGLHQGLVATFGCSNCDVPDGFSDGHLGFFKGATSISSQHGRIYVCDRERKRICEFVPQISSSSHQILLNRVLELGWSVDPTSISCDQQGCIYVTDMANDCILKYTTNTGASGSFSGPLSFVESISNRPGTTFSIQHPTAMAISGDTMMIFEQGSSTSGLSCGLMGGQIKDVSISVNEINPQEVFVYGLSTGNCSNVKIHVKNLRNNVDTPWPPPSDPPLSTVTGVLRDEHDLPPLRVPVIGGWGEYEFWVTWTSNSCQTSGGCQAPDRHVVLQCGTSQDVDAYPNLYVCNTDVTRDVKVCWQDINGNMPGNWRYRVQFREEGSNGSWSTPRLFNDDGPFIIYDGGWITVYDVKVVAIVNNHETLSDDILQTIKAARMPETAASLNLSARTNSQLTFNIQNPLWANGVRIYYGTNPNNMTNYRDFRRPNSEPIVFEASDNMHNDVWHFRAAGLKWSADTELPRDRQVASCGSPGPIFSTPFAPTVPAVVSTTPNATIRWPERWFAEYDPNITFEGMLNIGPEGSLTIDPGIHVEMTPSPADTMSGILVYGSLQAVSEILNQPITFHMANRNNWATQINVRGGTLSLKNAEVIGPSWAGVCGVASDITIDECLIAGCDNNLILAHGSARVENSIIERALNRGVYIINCDPQFSKNMIQYNAQCGVMINTTAYTYLNNNTISHNGSAGVSLWNGGVCLLNGYVNLHCNAMTDNGGTGLAVLQGFADLTTPPSDYPGGRNTIQGNCVATGMETIGQVFLEGTASLGLDYGLNSISAPVGHLLIQYSRPDELGSTALSVPENDPLPPNINDPSVIYARRNYWGTTDMLSIRTGIQKQAMLNPILQAPVACDAPNQPIVPDIAESATLFREGMLLEFAASYEGAEARYDSILEFYPKSKEMAAALTRIQVCKVWMNTSWPDIQAYFQAIADTAKDSDMKMAALNTRAWCFIEMNEVDSAIVAFQALIDSSTKSYEVIYNSMGLLLAELGDEGWIKYTQLSKTGGSKSSRALTRTEDEDLVTASRTYQKKLASTFASIDSLLDIVQPSAQQVLLPKKFALYQNYPNPFNPTTEIKFDLPEAVSVELRIYNILGQEVTKLIDDFRPAGAYRIAWDSKNSFGSSVASGVYVYQIKAGNFTSAKKMVLMR